VAARKTPSASGTVTPAAAPESLTDRLKDVRDRIADAAVKAKRDPSEVTLIAVTKSAGPESIRELLSLGVADLGENRVQQLQQRAAQLNEFLARRQKGGEAEGMPPKIRWHMIGHLQRNKVKALLPVVSVIHSIDSLRLAEELDASAAKLGRRVPVLMQVNASEEPQKGGVAVGAAVHLAEQIDSMPNLQMVGLMTMAEHTEDPVVIQRAFARTREIFEEMKWHKIGGAGLRHLSMGMSHDFEIAIAEGATMVRVGSALFGGRPDTVEEKEE
jgi:PLP dependent protein